jgi:hypothetical protein
MDGSQDRSAEVVPATLEREMELVRSAITMVAAGRTRRITLAGVRFADELLEPARAIALRAGVRIVPIWTADDAGLDIAVERIEG